MSYEVTLLMFGILLLLVGLVGKVKAKELEVGTSNKVVRVVVGSLGSLLIILSFSPDIARSWLSTSPPSGNEDDRGATIQDPIQVVRVGRPTPGTFSSHGFVTPRGRIIAFVPTADRTSYQIAWTESGRVREGTARVLQQRKDRGLAPFLVMLSLPAGLDPGPLPRIRNASSLEPGEPVERFLSSQDRTPGQVREVNAARELNVVLGRDVAALPLRNALVTSNISGPAEAGAPVLDLQGRLVAIVIGGNVAETISMPIETVKAAFQAAF